MVFHHIWWRLGGRGPGLSDLIILYSLSYRKRWQPGLISKLSGRDIVLHHIWWQLG